MPFQVNMTTEALEEFSGGDVVLKRRRVELEKKMNEQRAEKRDY